MLFVMRISAFLRLFFSYQKHRLKFKVAIVVKRGGGTSVRSLVKRRLRRAERGGKTEGN